MIIKSRNGRVKIKIFVSWNSFCDSLGMGVETEGKTNTPNNAPTPPRHLPGIISPLSTPSLEELSWSTKGGVLLMRSHVILVFISVISLVMHIKRLHM